MVSVKNGILRINPGSFESTMRLVYEICLFLSIVVYYDFYNKPLHNAGVAFSFLGTGCILLTKIPQRRINHISFGVWYTLFIIFARLSSIWAFSATIAATTYFNIMFYTLVISFGVTQYVEYKDDFERVVTIFTFAAAVIGITQLLATAPSEWLEGFFGSKLGGNNSNTFGAIMLFAIIFSFYKAYTLNKKLWYPIFLFTIFCCVLSSSRKALLISLASVIILILFSRGKKHRFLHMIITALVISLGFLMIFKVKALYDVIGWRLENLIKFSGGENVTENSLPMRKFAIDFAKQLFTSKPILGYGYSNYSVLMSEMTYAKHAIYAHNNYYEILVDLGIVGFIVYYSSHLYIAVKLLIKSFTEKYSPTTLLCLVVIVAKLVCDTASVSMLNPIFHIILAITFSGIFISSSKNDKRFFYETNNRR